MPGRAWFVGLATVLIVAALVTGALAGRAVIRSDGETWSPRRVTVDRGSRVVWRATSGTHDVTAYGGNWSFSRVISATGDPTAARVFRRTGAFRFRCTIHSQLSAGVCSGMCGRVRVVA